VDGILNPNFPHAGFWPMWSLATIREVKRASSCRQKSRSDARLMLDTRSATGALGVQVKSRNERPAGPAPVGKASARSYRQFSISIRLLECLSICV